MDEKVKSVTKYCESVRDNIFHNMEISPGFMALLQQCESPLFLLSEKEEKIEKLEGGIEKLKYSELCGDESYFIDAKRELYKFIEKK